MKQTYFKKYSNQELQEILASINHDLNLLPDDIQKYIKTENPSGGNINTRMNRCYNLIKEEVLLRFMDGDLDFEPSVVKDKIKGFVKDASFIDFTPEYKLEGWKELDNWLEKNIQ